MGGGGGAFISVTSKSPFRRFLVCLSFFLKQGASSKKESASRVRKRRKNHTHAHTMSRKLDGVVMILVAPRDSLEDKAIHNCIFLYDELE